MNPRAQALILALALAAVASCSDSGTGPDGPTPAAINPVRGVTQTGTVGQELSEPLVVRVVDAKGAGVSGVTVGWTAQSGGGSLRASSVRTDAEGLASVVWTLGTTAGPARAVASVAGLESVPFDAVAIPDAPAAMALEIDSLVFGAVGDTARVVATLTDRYGNRVDGPGVEASSDRPGNASSDVAVTWLVRDTAVAQVDASGILTALGNGATTVVAVATVGPAGTAKAGASAEQGTAAAPETLVDSAVVVVAQKVASVEIVADTTRIEIGDTTRLTVEAKDANGSTIDAFAVVWESADPGVATVDGDGLVTGRSIGRATLHATVKSAVAGATGEVTQSLEVRVVAPGGVYITGISPEPLRPGQAATIVGGGFAASPGENTVTVRGVPATVVSATDTALTVTLPPASNFGCAPTREVEVAVTVLGDKAVRGHPLAVARPLEALEPGEYLNIVDGADVACNEIPRTGGRYLVSVYNTSTSPAASTPFRLRGEAGEPPLAASVAALGPQAPQAVARPTVERDAGEWAAVATTSAADESRARADAHVSILERNLEMARLLGPPRRMHRVAAASASQAEVVAAAPKSLTVGSMVDLRVPNIGVSDFCAHYIPVRARVVYSGPKAVVLEDSVAPLAGTMDAHYRAIGQEYEETMHAIIEEFFGDPLAYDATVGGAGRILMLFSPKVNEFGSVDAFVASTDFHDRGRCPSSDEAAVFYGIAPTGAGSGFEKSTADGWLRSMRPTVIHEVKHITSFAERFARNATVFEESWLEESTAQIASELYAREIFGYAQHGDTDYASSLYCEIRPSWAECGSKPLGVLNHFVWLYRYLDNTTGLSPLGRTSASDATFYGSGWLFVRWALDHFAASESGFLRALTQEASLRGVQNLTARTGKSLPELLGPWSLSLYWDRPTAPGLSHPSWDLYDIYAGLHADLPGTFAHPYPLSGWMESFGTFVRDVGRLHGGTAAIFVIDGEQSGPQLLELQGSGGGTLPPTLRIAIMRVQ